MAFSGQHMLREYAGGSVGGILRKTQNTSSNSNSSINAVSAIISNYNNNNNNNVANEEKQLDFLVFGYACKVFRDDEKAREIDQGKHLIPWMGDSNLKIDRYDVRGALYELAPYEPPPGGYGNRLEFLSADEQRAEQLCEEERYMYLYNNEEEHILQQEEEMKRLKQATCGYTYNQVGFQYGDDSAPQIGPNPQDPEEAAAEQAFVLPRNFIVPPNIQLPDTMKQHAIIEKTARFIASQGIQMEILLKAKQSNNAQFEFLTQNSQLNPYYKFMMEAIKNGQYPVEIVPESIETDNVNANETTQKTAEDTIDSTIKTITPVPTIKYTPSENCAYTQLISKIKGVPLQSVINDSIREREKTPTIVETVEKTEDTSPKVEVLKNTSALALAQNYDSDTESEEEAVEEKPIVEPKLNFPTPVDNLKNIIDKTATYVIKNGRKFEETLRSKDEERFKFLLPDNEFYAYYLYKVTGDVDAASKEQKTRKAAAVAAEVLSRKGLMREKNASPTPVCFTIKAKEEATVTSLPVALPQDVSDEEMDSQTEIPVPRPPIIGSINLNLGTRQVPEQVQKAIQMIENQLKARNAQIVTPAPLTTVIPIVQATPVIPVSVSTTPSPVKQTTVNKTTAQERNAQFEQQQQNRQREIKRAEEKVKDKLAQIAREKLCGLISKEKQLQQERKRKAMAFLNQMKKSPQSETETVVTQPENKEEDYDPLEEVEHISSYGPAELDESVESTNGCVITSTMTPSLPAKIEEMDTSVTVVSDDDDDVELVSETRPPKNKDRRARSRTRSRSSLRTSTHKKTHVDRHMEESERERRHRHKSSRNASKKKKKSKKHDSSHSRSRSRNRQSRSHSKSKSKKHKYRH